MPTKTINLRIVVAWLSLVLGLLVTWAAWQQAREGFSDDAERRYSASTEQLLSQVEAAFDNQTTILNSAAGFIGATPNLTPATWRRYAQSVGSPQDSRGITYIGYLPAAKSVGTPATTGNPQWHTAEERGFQVPIVLPSSNSKQPGALGRGLLNDARHRAIAESARDAGTIMLSTTTLDSDGGSSAQLDAILIAPVYAGTAIPDEVSARRQQFRGVVYAALDLAGTLRSVLSSRPQDEAIDVEIYDGTGTFAQHLIFDSDLSDSGAKRHAALFSHRVTINIAHHAWTLEFRSLPGFERTIDQSNATLVLSTGLAFTILVFGIAYTWATHAQRTKDLAKRLSAELRRSEDRFRHLAHHDPLTGLPNRALLQEHVHGVLSRARRQSTQVAVLFIDLDRFKYINDTLGHYTGDQVLKLTARRIETSVREEDFVARMGGDEFVVVIADLKSAEHASFVAQNILAVLAKPSSFAGQELHVTPSIGISVFPQDGEDLEALLKNADSAMYSAKASGRNNSQFFTPEINTAVSERLVLESALHHASERNELRLLYQPQVELRSGRIVGVEALLRWRHPERGNVPAKDFIPIAEETGLIVPIGAWALREACGQLARWRKQGLTGIRLAVNFSARQLTTRNLADTVRTILRDTGIAPADLDLELTETGLLQNTDAAVAALHELKEIGVAISMDDFGTGYSSLSYLRAFPIDRVKIDRTFVRSCTTDANDATLVRALIDLAHSLNLRIVAEGVELAEQLDFLRRHRCDEAQGHHFAEGLEAEACFQLLSNWHKPSHWPLIPPALAAVR